MSVTIDWEIPPAVLAKAIRTYGDKVHNAAGEVAEMIAKDIEVQMKANAPWKDQTGHARRELSAEVEKAAKDIVEIYVVHGAEYGIYLELAMGQRFAIIQPTMQQLYPQIIRHLKEIFK